MTTTVYKPTGCEKVTLFKFDGKRIQQTFLLHHLYMPIAPMDKYIS